ncbi:MAG: paraslipin [Bacteriovoracaceae bacterium]|nr:paraslipin [Bacteriovoracaceae bacterium]
MDLLFFTAVMGVLFIYVLGALIRALRLVPARTEFIVERLGKYNKTLRAGFHLLIPVIDKVAFIQDLKERTTDVPAQSCFTKDEIQVEIDGVIYMQVQDSVKASYGITDYQYAAIQLAQTTTRAIIGTLELDRTFEEREAISGRVVAVLDEAATKWGVKILRFEIKNLQPPDSVRQAMEKQVTAERNRRAIVQKSVGDRQSKINRSEGQFQEMVNKSEGEKQKKINEAQGRAEEILSIGKATAESISKIAGAINKSGGQEAIKLEIGQKYFKTISKLSSLHNRVILPADLTNMNEMLKTLGLDI